MNDYSRIVKTEKGFVRRYIIGVDDTIYVKTSDSEYDVPLNPHNQEVIDNQLKSQLTEINNLFVPNLKRFVALKATEITLFTLAYSSVLHNVNGIPLYSVATLGYLALLTPNFIGLLNTYRNFQEIKNMNKISEHQDELIFDEWNEHLFDSLSEAGQEMLIIDNNLSLSNCDMYTSKDIKKLFKYKNIK